MLWVGNGNGEDQSNKRKLNHYDDFRNESSQECICTNNFCYFLPLNGMQVRSFALFPHGTAIKLLDKLELYFK